MILKKIKSFINICRIKLKEKTFDKRLKYLFFDNDSDTIIIMFSAFSGNQRRRYNYVKSLKRWKIDKLFILDVFGVEGSYHLFENGNKYPQIITEQLISKILEKKNYKHIYTAGSSKGGSCAIYFGLKFNVEAIFSGACQYFIGEYLCTKDHLHIFKGMMGEHSGKKESEILNKIMPDMINKCKNSSTKIHLLYSKSDKTYQIHILKLIEDLKAANIQFDKTEVYYQNHEDVGMFFTDFVKEYI